MSERLAFIEKAVQCPVCFVKVTLSYPNPKTYTPAKRDSDTRVVEYRWLEGYDSKVQPHYYAVWHCPQCMFANFAEDILNPRGDKEFYLREAFKQLPPEGMSFLSEIGGLINYNVHDFNGAVGRHLTAIYLAELPEKEHIDHHKLARLYLRLGWLYRESDTVEEVGSSETTALADIGRQTETIPSLLKQLHESVHSLHGAIENRKKEQPAATPHYGDVVRKFALKINELMSAVKQLKNAYETDVKTSDEALINSSLNSASALQQKLVSLRRAWPSLPTTERHALGKSINAFVHSFKHEKSHKTVEEAMGVVSLIVDLMLRVNDRIGALDFIDYVSKGGVSSKQDLTEKFQKLRSAGYTSAAEEAKLKGKLTSLDTTINKLAEVRRDIVLELEEEKSETITRVIAEHANDSPEEKAAALRAAGLHNDIVRDLYAKGRLSDDKKRGIFSR